LQQFDVYFSDIQLEYSFDLVEMNETTFKYEKTLIGRPISKGNVSYNDMILNQLAAISRSKNLNPMIFDSRACSIMLEKDLCFRPL